ncbi:MAG: hypothetical protein U0T56_05865 [Ferruginibacter sp.]
MHLFIRSVNPCPFRTRQNGNWPSLTWESLTVVTVTAIPSATDSTITIDHEITIPGVQ